MGPKHPTFTSHVQSIHQKAGSTHGSGSQTNPHMITVQKSYMQSGVIYLPKEYNPAGGLLAIESHQGFLAKTFHVDTKYSVIPNDKHSQSLNPSASDDIDKQDKENIQSQGYLNVSSTSGNSTFDDLENSFTNRIFTEDFEAKLRKDVKLSKTLKSHSFPSPDYKNKTPDASLKSTRRKRKFEVHFKCNYKQIMATCRMRELEILGCLIVEIFLSRHLRAQDFLIQQEFSERLKLCLTVLKYHGDKLPRCVKYAVHLLLQTDSGEIDSVRYPTVTDLGLPPPSAHQLLQPLLSCIFPFPSNFFKLYSCLSKLQEYSSLTQELNILYHFDCDGEMCSKYENIERTKILFSQNIGECKVKYCAKELEMLLFDINIDCSETVNILLPYVKEIIEDPCTSVLAAWYLFDPVARALGPTKATDSLLHCVLHLYENEQSEYNFAFNCKIAKLYHHSFLLCLIVRLGLKTFLENFITPLVEAVGGYKDYERTDIILHNHVQKLVRKTSNLKCIDDTAELENLSPLDEESSADSDKNLISPIADSVKDVVDENEPEVFEFENEEKTEVMPIHNIIEHLEHNVARVDLDFNHSTAEEALEENVGEYVKHEDSEDGANLSSSACPKSPTIPIPCSYHQSELITIGCDVGSKKNESDFLSKSDNLKKSLEPDFQSKLSDSRKASDSSSTFLPESSASTSKFEERKLKRNNFKISDMSADSLIWLSHRLGPVLTAKYISRNLLRMLTLCYVGKENLEAIQKDESISNENIDSVSIANWKVTGDRNASKVLHCLVSIAGILRQIYFTFLP